MSHRLELQRGKEKGGKKVEHYTGSDPKRCSVPSATLKQKKGDEDRRHVCVSTSVSDGRRPVR